MAENDAQLGPLEEARPNPRVVIFGVGLAGIVLVFAAYYWRFLYRP